MTDLPITFRDVINLWGDSAGSRIAMAAELPGASPTQVSKWFQRNSIPPEWWKPVLSTERARSAGVTADLLASIAARDFAEART